MALFFFTVEFIYLEIVDNRGVFNFECIFEKNLNIKPSSAIAYNTLGNGNIEPSKLYY